MSSRRVQPVNRNADLRNIELLTTVFAWKPNGAQKTNLSTCEEFEVNRSNLLAATERPLQGIHLTVY
jgi:hypothetical protein